MVRAQIRVPLLSAGELHFLIRRNCGSTSARLKLTRPYSAAHSLPRISAMNCAHLLQRVRIEALFNGAWQPASVLAAVGDGAKKLRGDCAKKTDPDVTDSNIEISCSKSVVLPPLSAEQRAILAVRNAVLTVPGQGRSHGTINETVTLYLTPGAGLRVRGGWSAKLIDGVYEVVFDFSPDGPAIWAFNPKTGTVKYINHVAKLMSYLVAD
jgi:hypothetical protein